MLVSEQTQKLSWSPMIAFIGSLREDKQSPVEQAFENSASFLEFMYMKNGWRPTNISRFCKTGNISHISKFHGLKY